MLVPQMWPMWWEFFFISVIFILMIMMINYFKKLNNKIYSQFYNKMNKIYFKINKW